MLAEKFGPGFEWSAKLDNFIHKIKYFFVQNGQGQQKI
jgi:hypothetical protein